MNMTTKKCEIRTELIHTQDVIDLYGIGGTIVLVTGVICNVLTLVIVSRLQPKAVSYQFILALAASDIAMGLSRFLNIYRALTGVCLQNDYVILCKFFAWLVYSSRMTSSWLTAAISICRAADVTMPNLARFRKPRVIPAIIIVIWVVVWALNSFYLHVKDFITLNGKPICDYIKVYRPEDTASIFSGYKIYMDWFDTLGAFILPFLAMIISDIMLIREVYKTVTQVAPIPSQQRKNTRMTVLVLAISLSFFAFNFPAFVCQSIDYWANCILSQEGVKKFQYYKYIFDFLAYCSSATDLFLYVLVGREIRRKTQELISRVCLAITLPLIGSTTTYSSSESRRTTLPLSQATKRDSATPNIAVINARPSAMKKSILSTAKPPRVRDLSIIDSSVDIRAKSALLDSDTENVVPPSADD